MTRNHQNDFESSDDSEESEYCAYSTIDPKWQRDYESGNFGADFPNHLQQKVDEPKPVHLSKETLSQILVAVRNKQNTQKPAESSAAQNAITAIIGTNLNRENANVTQETTQTNGVGQMSPPENNRPANLRNVPLPFKPMNYPPGFAPNPPYPLPPFNDQMPVPSAANPYFQQPPPFGSHNTIPVRPNVGNAFGLPLTPPQSTNLPMNSPILNYPGHPMPMQAQFQPQPGMPHQSIVHQNVHLPNMPPQSMQQPTVPYQNVQYQNVPMTNGGVPMANVQRPSDPRLRDRPPAPSNSFVRNESPMHVPIPTRPMNSMPRPAPRPASINRRRISLFDYRHRELERNYDNDNHIPHRNGRPINNELDSNPNGTAHNMVHTNGIQSSAAAAAAATANYHEDNHEEEDMFLSFSPINETPASSPATEPSTDSPIPTENGQKEPNERNGEGSPDIGNAHVAQEVEIKTEHNEPDARRTEQNEDEDAGDSDATEEFTLETFIRDHESKDPNGAVDSDDAATEILGERSPQYEIQEETDASDEHVNADPEEGVFQMDNDDNDSAFNENVEENAEHCADSEELLVPIQEHGRTMVNRVQRCYVILEDIRETTLMDKYIARAPPQAATKKKKRKKKKKELARRRIIQYSETSESDSESEPEQRHQPANEEPQKEEEVLEQAPVPETEQKPIEEEASQEFDSNENTIDVGALSDIVISSDDDDEAVNKNENNTNNNNNNNNTIVYEISSDSD